MARLRSTILERCYRWLGSSPFLTGAAAGSRFVSDSRLFTILLHGEFSPTQRREEILKLASLIRTRGDHSLLEIGTALGGTHILLSRCLTSPAFAVTVDLEHRYDDERLRRACDKRIDTRLLTLDSHAPSTPEVLEQLRNGGYDMLFIDGDHSYSGVRLDTLRLAPRCRAGGLVVFHDIQPAREEAGGRSDVYVGGVPQWWRQLRACTPSLCREYISDPYQSGFGIGVVELPSSNGAVREVIEQWAQLPVID